MKLNKRKMKLNKEDSSLKKVQMLFFPFLLSQSLVSSLKLSDKYSSFVEISIYPLSLRFISIQFLNKIPTLSNITNLTLINLTKNLYSSFHTSSFYISFSRYSVSLAIFHAFPSIHRYADIIYCFSGYLLSNVGISTQISKL